MHRPASGDGGAAGLHGTEPHRLVDLAGSVLLHIRHPGALQCRGATAFPNQVLRNSVLLPIGDVHG